MATRIAVRQFLWRGCVACTFWCSVAVRCCSCVICDMFWTILIFTLGLSPFQWSNTEIQRLVELLKTVILNDCASSTVSLYAGAANRWIDWCRSYLFPPLQSNPTAVAFYLTSLSDRGVSRSSICGAAYGIA